MAQLKVKKVEEETMTVSETDGEFQTVVPRRKKEKRKAQRLTESESESTAIEGVPQDKVLKKKKNEATKTHATDVPGTSHSEEKKVHPGDLRERSVTAFQKILNLAADAGIEGAKVHRILKAASELKELVNEALLENRFLEGKIESLGEESAVRTAQLPKKVEEKLQEVVPPKRPLTYAERVGVKARNVVPAAVKEPRNLLTVFPGKNEALKTSDDVKEAVKKMVSPREEGIGIRNVRKIHNNGILIETDKRSDIATILGNEKPKATGMEIGLSAKKQPRIIVFGVPRPSNDDQTLKEVIEHNFQGEEQKAMLQGCKVAFKTGDRTKEKCNIVLEVTKEARDILKKRERLYVGWDCCRFQDYVVPTRCFKCQSYGHITKHCKAEKETYEHCGVTGHTHKECTNKENPAICINCKRAGKPSTHSIKDPECFAYRAATQVVISRTDYGL